jgi:hypothetical protein
MAVALKHVGAKKNVNIQYIELCMFVLIKFVNSHYMVFSSLLLVLESKLPPQNPVLATPRYTICP